MVKGFLDADLKLTVVYQQKQFSIFAQGSLVADLETFATYSFMQIKTVG
jgi:hypothetical protein